MNHRKTLKPATGRKVRKPDRSYLAEQGEPVEDSNYWRRRLADGDVVEVKPERHRKATHQETPAAAAQPVTASTAAGE